MVDIRLYIGTLVAVLIFFGLGVLVGIGITREPRVEQLYQRIERQLQRFREETARELQKRDKQIEQLEGEIAYLRLRSKVNEQFIEKVAPMLVRNSLLFRNIGFIFTTPDANGELSSKAQAFLEKAGAKIPVKITLHPEEIHTADIATWRKVAEGLGLILDNADDEAIKSGVWKRIALIIRYGDSQNGWQVLSKFGWVKVSGNTQTPVGSVVLVCSGQSQRDLEQVKLVDLAFVQALKSVGVRTIISVSNPTNDKLLSLYQTSEASVVDHIDTPLGLLSLVAALIGRQDNYGFTETANRPFPEPEWFVQQGQ